MKCSYISFIIILYAVVYLSTIDAQPLPPTLPPPPSALSVLAPVFPAPLPIIRTNGNNTLQRYIISLNDVNSSTETQISAPPDITTFLASILPALPPNDITHVFSPPPPPPPQTQLPMEGFYGFTAFLKPSDVQILRGSDKVKYIEEDSMFSLSPVTSPEISLVNMPQNSSDVNISAAPITSPLYSWGLDRIDQRTLPLDGTFSPSYGSMGQNLTVYLIDTGCRTTHQEFGGRASLVYDIFNNGNQDQHGHGTHTAATVVGTNVGVAPRARVACLAVLDSSGSGSYSDVLLAMQYVMRTASRPAVLSMSLGGAYSAAINDQASAVMSAGIITVSASGNAAKNACSRDSNGVSPASTEGMITVGASNSSDQWATFSNYGSCVTVIAPGQSIISAWATSDSTYAIASGTSMAAPHVAGVAALLLNYRPTFTQAEMKNALTCMGTNNMITNVPAGTTKMLLFTNDMSCITSAVSSSSTGVSRSSSSSSIGNAFITSSNARSSTVGSNPLLVTSSSQVTNIDFPGMPGGGPFPQISSSLSNARPFFPLLLILLIIVCKNI